MAASGAPRSPPFRALSIDLWFTTVFHGPDDERAWAAARLDVLSGFLRRDGARVDAEALAGALDAARAERSADGARPVTVGPAELLASVLRRTGARPTEPWPKVVEAFAAAGLRERPPTTNPEARRLVDGLAAWGIPTVLLTNSGRPASTWERFFAERSGPAFRTVVSSCDLGSAKPEPTIFREAIRQLRVAPAELLHVGDRWELDVAGARGAGCAAALYTGLWRHYPAGLYPPTELPATLPDDVRVLERLDPLLDPALWRRSTATPTA